MSKLLLLMSCHAHHLTVKSRWIVLTYVMATSGIALIPAHFSNLGAVLDVKSSTTSQRISMEKKRMCSAAMLGMCPRKDIGCHHQKPHSFSVYCNVSTCDDTQGLYSCCVEVEVEKVNE